MSLEGESDFFEVHPRAHESGFNVDWGFRGKRVDVGLVFKIKGLCER